MTKEMAERAHEVHVIAGSPYPRTAPGVRLHKVESYSFWEHFDDRRAFFGRPPWTFFNPLNFWEFMATKQSLSQLLLIFSLRAYQLMKQLGPFDLIHDNQTLAYGHLLMQQHAPPISTVHHPLSLDPDNTLFPAGGITDRVDPSRTENARFHQAALRFPRVGQIKEIVRRIEVQRPPNHLVLGSRVAPHYNATDSKLLPLLDVQRDDDKSRRVRENSNGAERG